MQSVDLFTEKDYCELSKPLLTPDDFVEIGYTAGLIGYQGYLKISISELLSSNEMANLQFIYYQEAGMFVPYFIEEWGRSETTLTVKFEDLDDRVSASSLTNQPIYCRKDQLSSDVLSRLDYDDFLRTQIHSYSIISVESGQLIGEVTSVDEYPSGLMASLKLAADDRLVLIPLVEQFIVEIDTQSQKLVMDLPEGLY